MTLPQDRSFEYTAPQDGSGANFAFGGSFVVATSGAAGSQDLRRLAQLPSSASGPGGDAVTPDNAANQFIDCINDGTTTIYVLFGRTAPTPIIASTGVNTAGNCYPIFAGGTKRFWLRRGVDNFIGYVAASSTPSLRCFLSSRLG